MKRALLVLAVLIAIVPLALWWFFPTDDLLHAALGAVQDNAQPITTFRSSHLSPRGIVVDDVVAKAHDGTPLLAIQQLTVRPTLQALLHLRWHPLHITAEMCGGALVLDADFDQVQGGDFDAQWQDWHLERCGLPPALAAIGGRTAGTLTLHELNNTLHPHGQGHVDWFDARIPTPGGRIPGLEQVSVERLASDWRLELNKLVLSETSFKTPEVEGRGGGTVTIRPNNLPQTGLELRFAVRSQPSAPEGLQRALASLPPAPGEPGATLLLLRGTLNLPEVVRDE